MPDQNQIAPVTRAALQAVDDVLDGVELDNAVNDAAEALGVRPDLVGAQAREMIGDDVEAWRGRGKATREASARNTLYLKGQIVDAVSASNKREKPAQEKIKVLLDEMAKLDATWADMVRKAGYG
jgi:hypothetical protein